MNKQRQKGWARNLLDDRGRIRFTIAVRLFVILGIAGISVLGFTQYAHAAVSTSVYCSQYSGTQATACQDGVRGADCSDYVIIYDQATADICSKAQSAKASGSVTPDPSTSASPSTSTSVSVSPSPSTTPSTAIQDLLDQANNMSQYINLLHSIGPNANVNTGAYADNNYDSYVNGAGQQQQISVQPGNGCSTSQGSGLANSNNPFSSLLGNSSMTNSMSTLTQAMGALTGGTSGTGTSGLTSLLGGGTGSSANISSATGALSTIIQGLMSASGGNDPLSTTNLPQLSQLSQLSSLTSLLGSTGTSTGTSTTSSTGTSSVQGLSTIIQTLAGLAGSGSLFSNGVNSPTNGSTSILNGTSTNPFSTDPNSSSSLYSANNNALQSLSGLFSGNSSLTSAGGGSRCPAILMFNGGGWHADDGTSYCFATGSSEKNCSAGADGGSDGGVGDEGPPPGGGANQRGYTVIEVSYRLGSSSVYYAYEDVMRGIQHVLSNASLYGIDPSKVAIMGDSAGGSLAMRAAASGKTGARVAVGWSAPTNAYTALFKSYKSLLIGMDHSTCIPTDLAGLDNFTDLLTGGSGDKAQYGQGLGSNDFSGLTGLLGGLSGGGGGGSSASSNPLSLLSSVLQAGQYASDAGSNVETISKQLEKAYNNGSPTVDSISGSGLPSGVFNLSAKKLSECLDNFNVLSPALFASVSTPPTFLAGFDDDDLIDPSQLYGMRDKLHQLGIKSDVKIIPGDPSKEHATSAIFGATDNHLGYDPRFVCDTLNFIDSILKPSVRHSADDCATGSVATATGGTSSAGGGGGGGGGSPGGGSSCTGNNCATSTKGSGAPTADSCAAQGMQINAAGDICMPKSVAAAQQTQPSTTYNCLSGNDTLVGSQCTFDGQGGGAINCGSARSLGNGQCAYGAIVNSHNVRQSSPNCSSAGGQYFPTNASGGFQGDCWIPN